MKTNIPKIAITGGPCAGKTSALAYLYERLSSMGLHPLFVPESATTTILGGVRPTALSNVEFQKAIITLQLSMEDYFESLAKMLPEGTRPVLICDRGTLDSKAFCTPSEWKRVLSELGTNEVALRDERYQAVIHMVTAADGALDCYTLANNKARTETPHQARKSDRRLQQAWLHHAHLRVIPNTGDFAHKISEVGAEILKALGLPVPIEEERKFVLPPNAFKKLLASGIKCASVEIEQIYLLAPQGEERRLRKRSQGSASAHFHCIKSPAGKG